MTSGTKVLLALIALFVGVLVLYYGFLMPEGDHAPEATRGPARDVALDPASSPLTPAAAVATVGTAGKIRPEPARTGRAAAAPKRPKREEASARRIPASPSTGTSTVAASTPRPIRAAPRRSEAPAPNVGAVVAPPAAGRSSGGPPAPAAEPTPPVSEPRTYTIRSGDTLSAIAQQLLGSELRWESIARLNPGLDPARLQIGQVLKIPANGEAVASAGVASGDRYVVRAGDTLSSIARTVYGSSAVWDRIYEANRTLIGADPGALEVGMRLVLPPR